MYFSFFFRELQQSFDEKYPFFLNFFVFPGAFKNHRNFKFHPERTYWIHSQTRKETKAYIEALFRLLITHE